MDMQQQQHEAHPASLGQSLADQAFSRAAGAPLIEGNGVRLLLDATENYPAWLEAIASARHHVYFENFIICDDDAGGMFAEALIRKAREGARVRLIYDWLGCFGKSSRAYWARLRAGGVAVRCYNPPRLDAPFAWLSRDHRKMLAVDGQVGFITGLCVGDKWPGNPAKNIPPWRDTGVEIRGPAVAAIERAFTDVWAMTGDSIPEDELSDEAPAPAGDVSLRIVATVPGVAGVFRLDQLVASLATERLWLTDPYYAGTVAYAHALRAADEDGVDVRLLMPGASDLRLLKPLSRAGYRALLQSGVRVFEWNGPMLHAKTAVADGRWARVGSTNLNLSSWIGNCELDAVIEDEAFARRMEAMFLEDLENATEIVLDEKRRVRAPGRQPHARTPRRSVGSAGRAAAGALRIGNAVGAAFTRQRVLEPVEARTLITAGLLLLALAALFAFFPRLLVYPLVVIMVWISLTLLWTGRGLYRRKTPAKDETAAPEPPA
ncbi:MAG TPA: phospholipase D-like domain-containing protein [Haliangium sp.]|nr:phospholipase D-like domain-containing protein [Haliangium sp.]